MKLLTIEMKNNCYYINETPVEVTDFMVTAADLTWIFLKEKWIDYDSGDFRLVFDLDRKQAVANFADPVEIV